MQFHDLIKVLAPFDCILTSQNWFWPKLFYIFHKHNWKASSISIAIEVCWCGTRWSQNMQASSLFWLPLKISLSTMWRVYLLHDSNLQNWRTNNSYVTRKEKKCKVNNHAQSTPSLKYFTALSLHSLVLGPSKHSESQLATKKNALPQTRQCSRENRRN